MSNFFIRGLSALLVSVVAVAASGPVRAAPADLTYYAVGEHVCSAPEPGKATCFAMRRKAVAPATQGAMAFKMAGGARINGTIGPAGGLTPSDLATAYSLPTTGGAGQTVAIVDAYNNPNLEADLQVFDTQYGLPACTVANGCLTIVGQTGSKTALAPNDTTGWSVEEALDVQAVRSICQGCKILLVEANSSTLNDLTAAVMTAASLHPTEISNSWGTAESASLTAAQKAAFNHPHIVITASSGDSGYYNYEDTPYDNAPNFPASSPFVVAVGGTSLFLTQTGGRDYETVWNDDGPKEYFARQAGFYLGASGGGCSTLFAAVGWQVKQPNWSKTACGGKRLVADVAAVADYLTGLDIYDTYACSNGCPSTAGWNTYGGTSLSAPLIAGTFALAGGSNGLNYPALTLYGHPGQGYNVTVGGDGYCDGEGAAQCGNPNALGMGNIDCVYPATGSTPNVNKFACDAGVGFNGPTGMGTPKGLAMFQHITPTAPISGPASLGVGQSGAFTATPKDPFPGGSVVTYNWAWGDGATTTTKVPNSTHSYAAPGTFSVSLTVIDNYSVTGGPATFSVKVNSVAVVAR